MIETLKEKKMGYNAPDYKDNLYFEPKLTWDDIIKKLVDKGYDIEEQEGYVLRIVKKENETLILEKVSDDDICDCYIERVKEGKIDKIQIGRVGFEKLVYFVDIIMGK